MRSEQSLGRTRLATVDIGSTKTPAAFAALWSFVTARKKFVYVELRELSEATVQALVPLATTAVVPDPPEGSPYTGLNVRRTFTDVRREDPRRLS